MANIITIISQTPFPQISISLITHLKIKDKPHIALLKIQKEVKFNKFYRQ